MDKNLRYKLKEKHASQEIKRCEVITQWGSVLMGRANIAMLAMAASSVATAVWGTDDLLTVRKFCYH